MSCTPEIVSNIFRRLPVWGGGKDGMQEIKKRCERKYDRRQK